MKKQIWTLALAMSALCFVQTMQAQSFEKGKTTISVGYGLVNFGTLYKKYLTKDPIEDTKIDKYKVIPLALQAEYGLTNRWGLGISTYYEKYETDYSQKSSWGNERYNESDKIGLLSFMVRTNYHFGKNGSRFDPYAGVGLGFTNLFFNKADWFEDRGNIMMGELRLGGRYFFSEKLGVHLEGGLGTIFLQTGLTARF